MRQYGPALIAATALLVGSGIGYRALASRVADLYMIPPLPPGTLARLPIQLGQWRGRDQPLDERIIEIADVDDYVSRVYTRRDLGTVTLFLALRRRDVAYGVPARELVPHRPEVCYPAHGWSPDGSHPAGIEDLDGVPLPVKLLRFTRPALELQRVTVLAYYISNGRRGHSPSQLRSFGWLPKGDVRYVAQVEIAAGGASLVRSAEEVVRAFAKDSAPAILSLITEAVDRNPAREMD